ncbi:hypothetical protein K504DRAFT_463187 [Pleomassaria siparia CBS 279.74]|uniref:MYND-type domain-containing protein n=1 Tax=Pleomassaria siparia CBS 279.74 TaxID=1314801 RepID=A0A6G1JTY4_9PLEO|nr:hypothetical protein K504DRAFT_463187 [Pleomassaria siparia CBS 279.74]
MTSTTKPTDVHLDKIKIATPTPATTTPTERCAGCPKPGTLRCSRCKNDAYCSKECQKKLFKTHAPLCKTLAAFQDRPNPDMHRAIYFPEYESTPRFMWMDYNDPYAAEELLAHNNSSLKSTMIMDGDRKLQRRLGHNIQLSYRENFLSDRSDINMSIETFIGSELGRTFRGPFLAGGWNEIEDDDQHEDSTETVDLDTKALAPIVAFLKKLAGSKLPCRSSA